MTADQPTIFDPFRHGEVIAIIDLEGRTSYFKYCQRPRGRFRLWPIKDFEGEPHHTIDLRKAKP